MILHVDMDAFYAAIEERDRPELVGKPVIVGGSPDGRGVVAAANYAVRAFGVHSAMPTSTALRLCPHMIILPVRMAHYAAISHQIRDIFFRYTPLVEPLSLDEAFLDVTGCRQLFGDAATIAKRIKQDIKQETGLVASVGVAPNKFLAKIASDLEKPDALVIVDPAKVIEFLDPLPVGRLWGVGKVTGKAMQRLGVETIGQLRLLSLETLKVTFGDSGEHFWRLAQGIDDRSVVPDRDAKSISHETTFSADISDIELLRCWLIDLTEQVARRLRRHDRIGRTVQIKLRFSDFSTITRSRTLPKPTDVTQEILQTAQDLLTEAFRSSRGTGSKSIRLIGVGVSGLDQSRDVQPLLFDDPDEQRHVKQKDLDRVADAVRERFGNAALKRASVSDSSKNRSAKKNDQ
ncbi:MAG TPA: DNA polymerase IV [Planctomycetaceae bacterium]|nr:DNA polymerase IV [Planctomycetaceae bacterium]